MSRPEFLAFARDWTGEAMRYVAEDLTVLVQRAEALMLSEDLAAAAELWERVWNGAPKPAALAALILCELVESPTTHAPQSAGEEAAASREFIAWYRKLLAVKAQPTIVRLNELVEKLSHALPGAAKIIAATMAEMERCV